MANKRLNKIAAKIGAAAGKADRTAHKRLNKIAATIGAAAGKADRAAHKVAKAGGVAQEELKDITKQVAALQAQLRRTTKRLKKVLS